MLMSPNLKLKLSLFHTHFVLPKPVNSGIPHSALAGGASPISHSALKKPEDFSSGFFIPYPLDAADSAGSRVSAFVK